MCFYPRPLARKKRTANLGCQAVQIGSISSSRVATISTRLSMTAVTGRTLRSIRPVSAMD